ncbi:hypothetical protein JVU11DRAFT_3616 [Chiua virens]|nr:hypothetical protein JVU11DRAFT_3616 [Chiua virens]
MSSVIPSVDNTLGALFVGFSLSTVLFGMFLLQASNYYRQYHLDKTGYKIIVALLLVLETAHQAFIAHSLYYYTVTNFLNVLALEGKPLWSLVVRKPFRGGLFLIITTLSQFQLVIGAVVGTIVKFLFTLRVWRFSYGNIWLTASLLLLNFGQLALAIVYACKCYALTALPDLVNLRVLGVIALGIGVVNDIGIAIALCYFLQSMRLRYAQSDSVIRRLTLYALNTGVLTSTLSFTTLILCNFMPANFIFVGCYFVLSKVYAVSFVAALSTRQTARDQDTDGTLKKSLTRQSGIDQQSLPISMPTIIRNPPDRMEEVCESPTASGNPSSPGSNEEFVVFAPPESFGRAADPDPYSQDRPPSSYAAIAW